MVLIPLGEIGNGFEFTVFMLSMGIVQCFTEFIPSTFLGAPDLNSFESVLPAHRLFNKGKAFQVITLTTFGGLFALFLGTIMSPVFFLLIEENSETIIYATPFVLVFALIAMVLTEETRTKKIIAIFTIICATTQGFLFQEQIFALITGYFAVPMLLEGVKEKQEKIEQKLEGKINFFENSVDSIKGTIAGSIVALMPGIGSNTAALIVKQFSVIKNSEGYLTMLGAISVSNFLFAYAVLFASEKARNGAMIVVGEKIVQTTITFHSGLAVMLFAGAIGALLTIIIARVASKIIDEEKQRKASKLILGGLFILVGGFLGINGIIALIFSSALGYFVAHTKVKRSTCMACLIVPVMLFYLFILF